MSLEIVPVSFRQACAFVAEHHRHHKPPRGMKFALGCADGGVLHGVALVGRPVARAYDDGRTAEVNRTCTDGTKNANSILYGDCWRTARGMGYRSLITYTQDGETGASLRAANWVRLRHLDARMSWADSSIKLRDIRDPVGSGGVGRDLWAAPGSLIIERLRAEEKAA